MKSDKIEKIIQKGLDEYGGKVLAEYKAKIKQSASEEKIESILKDWGVSIVESYKMGVDEYREWRKSLAESISKSIIGK